MNSLANYSEGDQLYQSMLSSIAGAKESIDLESYIFANDKIGNQFVEVLNIQAKLKVKIRILIDSVGSKRIKNKTFYKEMLSPNIQLKWFNPWSYKKPLQFNRRNHRKLLIIDGKICYLGGFNVHNESSYKESGGSRWKDSHISFEGSLVSQLKQQFELIWQGKFKQVKVINSHDKNCQVIPNQTRACRIQLRCQLIETINQSVGTIRIATPYFVPDSKTLKALVHAAQNGIRVDLLVPKYSDHVLLKYAAFWYYQKLITAGIYIHEYRTRMMHSKYIISDNKLGVIGSANIDYRSFFINYEIMLFCKNKALINQLSDDFECSLSQSDLVEAHHLKSKNIAHFMPSLVAFFLRRWL
jgi:Phosphatidylserine/phosphatidylglycerophosphate/cardiolipin synthases and related enzymes